jgi:Tfp pilus assembly protein PilN
MSELIDEPNNSIIETSLAELAFALFFVLLIFSVFKINEARSEKKMLEEENLFLEQSLSNAAQAFGNSEEFDPKEVFKELARGKQAMEKLKTTLEEKKALNERLDSLKELEKQLRFSPDNIAKKLAQLIDIKKSLEGVEGEKELAEKVKELLQKSNDFRGQNKNLRATLAKAGNGLDHPPCWADPETGRIQYVYNVIINEASIEFLPGWPKSRNEQALADPHIIQIAGLYTSNEMMWKVTKSLYEDSVKKECKHFVRIYDHAKSKDSFKRYLFGIENHFYKFLSKDLYERTI